MYVDHQYPRNLIRDEHGYVVDDRKSCGYFDDEGNDNGLTTVIENQFDYHNIFTGGYDFGDISFKAGFIMNRTKCLSKIKPDQGTHYRQCCAQFILEEVEKLCR